MPEFKIYTSYFAKIKNYPDIIPVSIARITPHWFDGMVYPELAPPDKLLVNYKAGKVNDERYTEIYNKEVLGIRTQQDVISQLYQLCGDNEIALCCYEKTGKFCHRHIVAQWLSPYIHIEELL